MIGHRKIAINKNFNEQYTIDIESEVNGVDVYITSKVRLRYDFTVSHIIENESFHVRLVQLDNVLLEANSPLVKEVSQVSQIFGRMYSELNLLLDPKGKLLEVLNYDLILSKWQETKAEMERVLESNDDIKAAIVLNDQIFTSPDKVKIAIEANEFFKVYFGQIFSRNLPVTDRVIEGTNFFSTANLQWNMNITTSPFKLEEQEYVDVTMEAKPASALTKGFYNAAYNQFNQKIDISTLNTILEQKEIRKIEVHSGRLAEALIVKNEIAHPEKLFMKVKYIVRSDSFGKEDQKNATETAAVPTKDLGTKSRFNLVID